RCGEMVLAAGETTVTVRGKGKGGRNQEVALGALPHVADDALVLSCASDGIDNTPVAGAIADAVTRRRAAAEGLDAAKALADNASFVFFKAAGQQIVTGKTGANVSDLMIAARAKSKKKK
ncbi:MAG TPA: MOFRL family protein, partial [Patescibacteria group bacterium]|nr:MOFRL family protein [Patescibacteria group bacterium]